MIATLNRLERLLSDSGYDNCRIEMDFDEKLEIRSISSQLAASLFDYYYISNQPIPNVIDKWRKACMLPEEFSEIRNPWRNCKANSELLI